jgi:hypothetical protein
LRATGDITRFPADDVIRIANANAQKVTELCRSHPGGNVSSLTVTPRR